ncbi:hypothetical protein OUZ56_004633 [Daphnia magna]|uniref:Uncharacterized protein n=1 Tax=Daphnia magna TaxID=35525 RepID=A0ABQ9YQD3_9CRUS|nr:hypothetical protein OUZ56_004633 [Daphnia magna]
MACCISRHPLIWWRSNNYFCVFKTLQLLLGETTLWGPHLGSRVVNRKMLRPGLREAPQCGVVSTRCIGSELERHSRQAASVSPGD